MHVTLVGKFIDPALLSQTEERKKSMLTLKNTNVEKIILSSIALTS
jgi:hypothetical protein